MTEKTKELQKLLELGRNEIDYDFLTYNDNFDDLNQDENCSFKQPATKFEVIPTYELQMYNGE